MFVRGVHGSQKKALDLLSLELETVVNCPTGIKN